MMTLVYRLVLRAILRNRLDIDLDSGEVSRPVGAPVFFVYAPVELEGGQVHIIGYDFKLDTFEFAKKMQGYRDKVQKVVFFNGRIPKHLLPRCRILPPETGRGFVSSTMSLEEWVRARFSIRYVIEQLKKRLSILVFNLKADPVVDDHKVLDILWQEGSLNKLTVSELLIGIYGDGIEGSKKKFDYRRRAELLLDGMTDKGLISKSGGAFIEVSVQIAPAGVMAIAERRDERERGRRQRSHDRRLLWATMFAGIAAIGSAIGTGIQAYVAWEDHNTRSIIETSTKKKP